MNNSIDNSQFKQDIQRLQGIESPSMLSISNNTTNRLRVPVNAYQKMNVSNRQLNAVVEMLRLKKKYPLKYKHLEAPYQDLPESNAQRK